MVKLRKGFRSENEVRSALSSRANVDPIWISIFSPAGEILALGVIAALAGRWPGRWQGALWAVPVLLLLLTLPSPASARDKPEVLGENGRTARRLQEIAEKEKLKLQLETDNPGLLTVKVTETTKATDASPSPRISLARTSPRIPNCRLAGKNTQGRIFRFRCPPAQKEEPDHGKNCLVLCWSGCTQGVHRGLCAADLAGWPTASEDATLAHDDAATALSLILASSNTF